MNQEEQKKKYSAFISDVSEILGLGKPIDILKLCMITDRFFKPLQNQVKELEAQIEKMKWHDLLKDPTDVPQNKRKVWCITSDGGKEGFYDKKRKTPWVIGSSYWSTITAWCELPEWEEKK